MNCVDCRFWASETKVMGRCHRYPPITVHGINAIRVMLVDFHWTKFEGKTGSEGSFGAVDEDDMSIPYFPATDSEDWCGEFQATVKPLDEPPEQGVS